VGKRKGGEKKGCHCRASKPEREERKVLLLLFFSDVPREKEKGGGRTGERLLSYSLIIGERKKKGKSR